MHNTSSYFTPSISHAGLLRSLAEHIAKLVANVQWQRRRWQTRKELEVLTPEQLADVGIDPCTIWRPKPAIEARPGLMIELTSMR